MTFTDDDLKWLKDNMNLPSRTHTEDVSDFLDKCDLEALLARLEAAEDYIECNEVINLLPQEEFDTSDRDGNLMTEHRESALKTWRKAAGK